jgi:hypothetical protein
MATFPKETHNMSERSRILAGLAAEVSFAVLPLVVMLMVLVHAGHSNRILSAAEWSFGASILFGQTLVKFVSGLARGGSAAIGPVALAVALLVVFGLSPSLMVLTMTLQAAEAGQKAAPWLCGAQVFLFCGSAIVYMLLGTVGEMWRQNEPGRSHGA